MATNATNESWRVKVTSLPTSITVNELSEALHLKPSLIMIPRNQTTPSYYAWINGFNNETATEFVAQWSGASVFGTTIRCTASLSKHGGPNTQNITSSPKQERSLSAVDASTKSPKGAPASEDRPGSTVAALKPEASGES